VTNIRQKQALGAAIDSLRAAQTSLKRGLSSEFVAVDLRQGLDRLGEIIGEVTTEDILGNIFSKFCIGK
jgi:tRNA modification GTPase